MCVQLYHTKERYFTKWSTDTFLEMSSLCIHIYHTKLQKWSTNTFLEMISICIHIYHAKEQYFKTWSTDENIFFEITWYRSRPLWRIVLEYKFYVYTAISYKRANKKRSTDKNTFLEITWYRSRPLWRVVLEYKFYVYTAISYKRAVLQKMKYRYLFGHEFHMYTYLSYKTSKHEVPIPFWKWVLNVYICIIQKRKYLRRQSKDGDSYEKYGNNTKHDQSCVCNKVQDP